jgi:hypothetical protein
MRGTFRMLWTGALALTLLCLTTGAWAQDFRGTIAGRITDGSGGRLPGATVTATNVATNVGSSTTTNSEGSYTISYLTPGRYTLVAEISGFKKFMREGIDVRVGDALTLQAVGQCQAGRPISFHDRNIYFNGDLNSLKTDYSGDSNDPVWNVSGFYFHDVAVPTPALQRSDSRINLANNIRYFPSRVPGLRGDAVNLWDISVVKQVRFTDRVRAQFHVEFLNAFNHPVFSNPNTNPTDADFGKVTGQANLPRQIQLAAKLIF